VTDRVPRRSGLALAGLVAGALTCAAVIPAAAQRVDQVPAAPAPASPATSEGSAAAPAPAAPPLAHPVEIAGFRSAAFGMTERQLRAAVAKDFGIKPAALKAAENPVEKTRVLTAVVPHLLPGGLKAQISYVLGYRTRKLIQVGLLWSKAIDRATTSPQLIADAQLLQAYFRKAGYQPESITLNAPFAAGVVVFRGSDAQKRATLLVLQGKIERNRAGANVLTTAEQLSLFYSADPDHPDVAAIAPKHF